MPDSLLSIVEQTSGFWSRGPEFPIPLKGSPWTFLVLPKDASAKLPTRGMTTVEGIINGHPFRATLEPNGQKSHWLKLNKKMREAAGAEVGDVVPIEILLVGKEPEPRVPVDLRKALAAAPKARALWSDITPVARRDWIAWITSAKRLDSRARGIHNACEMLAAGKRRACCGRCVRPDEPSIEREFNLVRSDWQFPSRFNVAPTQNVPVTPTFRSPLADNLLVE